MNCFVKKLEEIQEDDFSLVGGKAANLAKLIRADIPVPDGIVVGLSAFGDDGKLKPDAEAQIKQAIESDKTYAVRSSALAEDAEGASWAGQFETFLDTEPADIIAKVEECHNSAKARAEAYAQDKSIRSFDVAVVVQEMLKPIYAGVLFTKDPLSGEDHLVTEYVEGLGEELVSGRADPKRVVIDSNEGLELDFDYKQLIDLAQKTEKLFGMPQDIEWVWAHEKIWLVQARPITVTQTKRDGYYLGEPDDLFYWGPSRTEPMYMSDWLAATDQLFAEMTVSDDLPTPPKTLVIFHGHKMVYLCNAEAFGEWCEQTFEAYVKQDRLEADMRNWQDLGQNLNDLKGDELTKRLVEAWYATILPEFSLYGAEQSISQQLQRFDSETRQKIWGAFTVPDKPTFLAKIDNELSASQNPEELAKKYPWINDGYHGTKSDAEQYFIERLKVVGSDTHEKQNNDQSRQDLIKELKLSNDEVQALTLARQLAEFMDDRKAWMMQTRRLITKSASNIEHGWFFDGSKAHTLKQEDSEALWLRYVDFKAASNIVSGIVASNGGKHYVSGEVVVVDPPTDVVEDDRIVVVPSTSPSYVPLMRKARALVTDHGGMMSHAAIVAREFNLPCIVGTKHATKVLKSGDKVVLDLVKGEVNK